MGNPPGAPIPSLGPPTSKEFGDAGRFLWAAVGAVVPKIISSYQTYVTDGKPLPTIHWYEPPLLLFFMFAAGAFSVILETPKKYQAFYVGFSLPIIATTYFPSLKPQDVLPNPVATPPAVSGPAVPGKK
jgi:hypothetical protein